MKHDLHTYTEDEFDELFPLLPNHLNPHAGWCCDESHGCLFETYGSELAFVLTQDRRRIWTLVDGENDTPVLLSGFHIVNRIGYLVSRVPLPVGVSIRVPLDSALQPRDPVP